MSLGSMVQGGLWVLWGGLALGALGLPRESVPWISAMLIPLCGAGFLGSSAVIVGLTSLSLVVASLSVFRGISAIEMAGPWTSLAALGCLLWINQREFRFRTAAWQTQQSISLKALAIAQQEIQTQEGRIRSQEAQIGKIADLYGLAKEFLATLELDKALVICQEALDRWIPQLRKRQQETYLEKIKALVQNRTISMETLLQAIPMAGTRFESRERWGIVSGQLALGLQRIALYRQVQESAIHEGLTGLLSRRFFRQRLKEELERVIRQKKQLAFLMIDLDEFKKVNDTYGHLVGDVVLREVAHQIRRSVREMDVVGRYGGEEFGVVLPDADQSLGIQIADRIRNAVSRSEVKAYDEVVRMTVSVGVALCPEHAAELDPLLEYADQAMYQAKQLGRNKTILHEGSH